MSRFEQLQAVRVRLQFGGTAMLISQEKLVNNADALISADQISADQISTDQLIRSSPADKCLSVVF